LVEILRREGERRGAAGAALGEGERWGGREK
jgi:hypothetical protein